MAETKARTKPGPKRAPQDTEQLLCAMLMERGLPSGAGDWLNIANRMPDKSDGSGEKPSREAVRSMWRRLMRKWKDDGIWKDNEKEEEEAEDDASADDDDAGSHVEDKASKIKVKGKAKGKGKEKEAMKTTKSKKAVKKVGGATELKNGFEAEGSTRNIDQEENSDAEIIVVVPKKKRRLTKHNNYPEDLPLSDDEF